MRTWSVLCWSALLLVVGLPAAPTAAQQPVAPTAKAEQPTRRPAFGPPLVSPEVHADRRVTFRLRAPNAKDVIS
ncbi:MAG TPA: hypothetical protein VKA15_12880 [Isosphaeraceae bacterium]|nr:hypothetical protein [Isosphaeraceae bacterium]